MGFPLSVYEYARDVAMHPGLRDRITVRHLELRVDGGFLRVVASDAPKLHGTTPTLVIVDEMQAFRDDSVYLALRTAVHKRPGAQMWVISTASRTAEDPLGKLRLRARGQPAVKRRGGLVVARGPALTMLEWSAPEERRLGGRAAAMANPASWLSAEALREQRQAVPEPAYRQYHLNQWVGKIGSWLPAGSWQGLAGEPRFEEGERIHAAVDLGGGQRSTSALVWVQRHDDEFHVGSASRARNTRSSSSSPNSTSLGRRFRIAELTADEWRAPGLLEEARQRGIPVTVFPQSDSRMAPASQRLYELITAGKIVHAGDELLDAHVLAAVALQSRRGWRLERPDRNTPPTARSRSRWRSTPPRGRFRSPTCSAGCDAPSLHPVRPVGRGRVVLRGVRVEADRRARPRSAKGKALATGPRGGAPQLQLAVRPL